MGFFDSIFSAKTPIELATVRYEEPSLWDRFMASKFGGDLPTPERFSAIRDARLGQLQAQEAAPVAKMLSRFAAEGNDADPNFTGSEWIRGMATTPALGGTMSEQDYDAMRTGAVPGFKKGATPLTEYTANPIAAKMLQDAEQNAQTKGTVARVFDNRATPTDLATVAMNKDLAGGFDNTTQGGKRIFDQNQDVNDREQLARAERLANFLDTKEYGYQGPDGWVPPMTHFKQVLNAASTDFTSPKAIERLAKFQEDVGKQFDKQVNDQFTHLDEAALTLKAINGDAKAQEILDRMQQRKKEIAQDTRTVITSNPMPSKMGININGLSVDENAALDRAIQNGLDPYKVNSRTGKIYAQLELKNPGRDWNKLGAQAAFERSTGAMNTKALLNTISPLLDSLVVKGKEMTDTGSPLINKPLHTIQKYVLPDSMGGDKVTGFDNFRDDTIAEVERGLMGTGVLSDSKYQRALANLNSAQTDKQRRAAVNNIKEVIKTRLESLSEGPNPTANRGQNAQQKPNGSIQDAAAAELKRRGL